MKNLLVVMILSMTLWMCGSNDKKAEEGQNENPKEQVWFGAEFPVQDVVDVHTVLAKLSTQDSVPAVVKAKVGDVCQKKGCWMDVSDGGEDTGLFVQFEDYGFFMPKDLGGHEVVMKGYAYKEVTSVEELRHYAEDEGQSAEEIAQITEPQEEYKFMATGVKKVK